MVQPGVAASGHMHGLRFMVSTPTALVNANLPCTMEWCVMMGTYAWHKVHRVCMAMHAECSVSA